MPDPALKVEVGSIDLDALNRQRWLLREIMNSTSAMDAVGMAWQASGYGNRDDTARQLLWGLRNMLDNLDEALNPPSDPKAINLP